MSYLCWQTDAQMARLQPYAPKSHSGSVSPNFLAVRASALRRGHGQFDQPVPLLRQFALD